MCSSLMLMWNMLCFLNRDCTATVPRLYSDCTVTVRRLCHACARAVRRRLSPYDGRPARLLKKWTVNPISARTFPQTKKRPCNILHATTSSRNKQHYSPYRPVGGLIYLLFRGTVFVWFYEACRSAGRFLVGRSVALSVVRRPASLSSSVVRRPSSSSVVRRPPSSVVRRRRRSVGSSSVGRPSSVVRRRRRSRSVGSRVKCYKVALKVYFGGNVLKCRG